MFKKNGFFLFLILFQFSCNNEIKEQKKIIWTKNQSADFNKNLAVEEEIAIKIFLASKPKWKANKTESGLWYYIYHKGNGEKANSGMIAKVKFKINLLDGKLCYQTENNDTQEFKIDASEIESGIQEGIKLMDIGDKAKFIIPSHLAHGLIGDRDKIPPLTTIIVDLELVSLTVNVN
jgi:FKBP-type peptidyl-prolyl cis-trans isomerase FkpA